ncbi:uncharacterized protein LOC118268247 [Spodoptera frugiperda]|uniref:Uncharacterized protein LOC118268247 n=1 Tax=Spodoptera frugiperda TaxID=7108 RepID=A0A9R0D350_SPOFR|nr:uncharacterized protein LOC118268247 [Spodoptera frugiperda]
MYRNSFSAYLTAVLLSFSKSMGNPLIDGEILTPPPGLLDNLQMPAACEDQTFCFEKGDNYPDKLVEDFLKAFPLQDTLGPRIGFSFRDGDKESGNADCPANNTFVDKPIYYIFDEEGKVRAVIQSPKKFEQIYSTRWCVNEGIVKDTEHVPLQTARFKTFQVECVTKYMDFEFIVLEEDFDQITYKTVKAMDGIPVCCRCQYHRKKIQ